MKRLNLLVRAFSLFTLSLFTFTSIQAAVTYASPLTVDGEEFEIGNLLEWSTATEMDSEFFFIEKSLDGTTFETIGKVEAAGLSDDEVEYRYMDIQVTDKKVFYRLRQTDVDGTQSTSETATVVKKLTNQFMIIDFSDITVNELFEVTIDAMTEGEMEYTLSSYKGEVIFNSKQPVINGINEFQINMKDEKEGKYNITFKMGEEQEKLNIIKLEDEMKKKPNVASKKSSNGG